MLPSPCHERDRWRTPVKARNRCRRPLLELPRGEVSAPFSGEGAAPVRFCHRGYPASTEPHVSSTSSNPRFLPVREGEDLPVFPREELGWAYRELSLSLENDL
jgi:hypothetical protein